MVQSRLSAHVAAASSILLTMVIVMFNCGQALGQTITSCVYDEDSCGCETEEGLISLKYFESDGLVSSTSPEGGKFLWNPCRDLIVDRVTAACIQHFDPNSHFDCGIHASVTSSVSDGRAVFHMESMDYQRESKVTCQCGSAERLNLISEEPTGVYNLDLISIHCCPGSADKGGRRSKHLSASSVVLLVFSSLVFLYFIGGVIVRSKLMHAKGRDRIPHVELWASLLSLIAVGFGWRFLSIWVMIRPLRVGPLNILGDL